MTYKEIQGDLFLLENEYYLAHCISADFKLGAGIAVEFDRRYNMAAILHTYFPNYLREFKDGNIGGSCILYGKVFNLITKNRYWEKPTNITMYKALLAMKDLCLKNNIKRLAMPKIGSGLDKLKWEDVSKLIQGVFKDTDIEIVVCKR